MINKKSIYLNKYLKFRKDYSILIYYLQYFVITLSALLIIVWESLIFWVVGLIFVLGLLEYFIVKCPHCRKRPVSFWRQFPAKCRSCGKELK